ncbi:MAG: hypothetical protein HQL52_05705 [Magnetococcales bacterium]|nr:hypothetical protein [Magnetococcales bacterium]
MKIYLTAVGLFALLLPQSALGEQLLFSTRVEEPPVIDGQAEDPAWAQAKGISTQDRVTRKHILLKSVHTAEKVFFLARFADDAPEQEHKNLLWDEALEMYRVGPKREDSFVFKWNMEPYPVDLTLTGDTAYRADIWFWKGARTDHAGYADDKIQFLSELRRKQAKRVLTKKGRLHYLTRMGDKGDAAYETQLQENYNGPEIPQFRFKKPTGSRADVQAKGAWQEGTWTIEFGRKLNTGHGDDLAFVLPGRYQFGVSIFEIAGRKANPKIDKPLYGSGEVGEALMLVFE